MMKNLLKLIVLYVLSAVLKNSFFTALSHQLSHLENHRMVLISLVYYIDNMITNDEGQLRTPLSDEVRHLLSTDQ